MENLKSTSDLAVKIQKMARLAFDPAAAEGEARNAAVMIVQLVRKQGLNFDGFKKLIGVISNVPGLKSLYPSGVMTFGKYEGVALMKSLRSTLLTLVGFCTTLKAMNIEGADRRISQDQTKLKNLMSAEFLSCPSCSRPPRRWFAFADCFRNGIGRRRRRSSTLPAGAGRVPGVASSRNVRPLRRGVCARNKTFQSNN